MRQPKPVSLTGLKGLLAVALIPNLLLWYIEVEQLVVDTCRIVQWAKKLLFTTV